MTWTQTGSLPAASLNQMGGTSQSALVDWCCDGAVTADVSAPWCTFRTCICHFSSFLPFSLKTSSDFGLCLSYHQFIFVSVSFVLLWILMETPAAAWDWKLSADLSSSLWDICTYLQTRGFHLQDKRETLPLFFRCNHFIHKRKKHRKKSLNICLKLTQSYRWKLK